MSDDTVVFVVAKGKQELSRRAVRVGEGSVIDVDVDVDAATAPDVTFTMTPELAADLDAGTLDVSVGFMRGAIKMSGDYAALLRVLPTLRSSTPARP